MFLFNYWHKITDFLEGQQFYLEKSRYKVNYVAHSAKVQVQHIFRLFFGPLLRKLIVQPLSY